jgi:hypothetical protein
MLREEPVLGEHIGSYTDVVLRSDRSEYLGFLALLVARGLITLTRDKVCGVTPFFVQKNQEHNVLF